MESQKYILKIGIASTGSIIIRLDSMWLLRMYHLSTAITQRSLPASCAVLTGY